MYTHTLRAPLSKHRIETLDMTLAELSDEGGVHLATLSNIERGYWHIRRRDRQKYANLYRLSLEAYEEMVRSARESA